MNRPSGPAVDFRLSSPSLDVAADVQLRPFGDRWVAVARIADDHHVGIGSSPRQALVSALASLGDIVTRMLLADTSLLGPSAALLSRRPEEKLTS